MTGGNDKLVIDGEVTYSSVAAGNVREMGRNLIKGIPLYDRNQKRYESNKSAERKALKAIEQVANGDFEPWVVEAIKANMCRSYDRTLESNVGKARMLLNSFIDEEDLQEVLDFKDAIMNVSVDDVKRVAKQYLNKDYIFLNIEPGKNNKNEKIEKPGYDPIEPPVGQKSLYAQQFSTMSMGIFNRIF